MADSNQKKHRWVGRITTAEGGRTYVRSTTSGRIVSRAERDLGPLRPRPSKD